MRRIALLIVLFALPVLWAPPSLASDPISGNFGEGFENIGILSDRGWVQRNNSSPTGATGWFQGTDRFAAHEGPEDSYIAANFNNAGGAGTISNWLMTPEMTLLNGTRIRFWTRTTAPPPGQEPFPDRLEVRLSTSGAGSDVGGTATSVGSFTTELLTINPDLSEQYPVVWTQYEIELDNITEPASGRIGFRYYVTDSGPFGDNGNFIGIDTFSVIQPVRGVIFRDRFEEEDNL